MILPRASSQTPQDENVSGNGADLTRNFTGKAQLLPTVVLGVMV